MVNLAKKVLAFFIVTVFMAGAALPVHAQATLDDILKRVEALEQENAALKAEVLGLKDRQAAQAAKIASVEAAPAQVAAAVTSPTGNFMKTKLETELYGFVGVTAAYSDSDANSGTTTATTNSSIAASTASRETTGKNFHAFNTSAQDTRLGLNFKGPQLDDGGKLSGKFEMDFSANNGPTYQPRLRLAYAQLDYEKWGFLAGQNWDFFAPLNPAMLNSGVLFRAGNFGFRHPQMVLTNKWGGVPGGKLTTKVGILDSDDPYQENSGSPVSGAYASYETSIFGAPTTVGVGGIYGRNSTDVFNSKGPRTNDIYAVTANLTTKIGDKLSFKAEGLSGAKLDDFTGGPTVGVTNTTALADGKALKVMGGFVEANYLLTRKLELTAGMGLDDVKGDSTIAAGERDDIWNVNRAYYSNLKYNISKDLMLGLEYNFFDTRWFDGVKGESNRVLSSVVYKF